MDGHHTPWDGHSTPWDGHSTPPAPQERSLARQLNRQRLELDRYMDALSTVGARAQKLARERSEGAGSKVGCSQGLLQCKVQVAYFIWLSRWYGELGRGELTVGLMCSPGVALLNWVWRKRHLDRCGAAGRARCGTGLRGPLCRRLPILLSVHVRAWRCCRQRCRRRH